MPVEAFLCF